ncbi:MAG TPA: MXAN_5187 C-terminal domain-containing protein [Luteitalea sp.]|nr:MXAN_5187 C-terminal domain-containing protein [Luteitalea sp.]
MGDSASFERDLQALATQLRKVEAEYTMYFSGRVPRPPVESRLALDRAVKKFDRTDFENPTQRFQFSSLQARYSSFCELWDRNVRAREEGRTSPFQRAPSEPATAAPRDDVLHATRLDDPASQSERLHDLYDAVMDARRQDGQDVVPFHKFATLVREQVRSLHERHPGDQVWFRVTRRDGKVNLSARAVKDGDEDAADG